MINVEENVYGKLIGNNFSYDRRGGAIVSILLMDEA